ncbi:histidine kinase [Massilia cavernae]
MLFNTLANLQGLIAIDPERAQAMLDQLIHYLRATLSASRSDDTTLAREFALIDAYLGLMSVRMGKRLSHTLLLPPELENAKLPPSTFGSRPWTIAFSTSGCSSIGGSFAFSNSGGSSSVWDSRFPMRTDISPRYASIRANSRASVVSSERDALSVARR